MKIKKLIKRLLPLGALALILSGCALPGLGGSSKDTVKIAAQNTTEQQIMSQVLKGMIEHYSNLNTEVINNLGSGTVSFQAQKQEDADMTAIRYKGTDDQTILKNPKNSDPNFVSKRVRTEFDKKYDMKWFPSYGFSDTYQFMVKQDYAKKYHLETDSDLKKIAPNMKVGIDQIWMNRKGDGYGDFKEKYGFAFGHVYPMQIGLVYNAVQSDKMNAVLGYSTDGRIGSYNLKLLKDDKHFFPPYDASVVVNNKALKKHPQLNGILHRLDGKIDLKMMQHLNYEVDNNLKEPSVVAKEFLKENNYFEGGK